VVGSHREMVVRGLIGGVRAGERFGRARGGFAGRPPTRPQYGFRRDDPSFGFQRNYGPRFPPRGARTPSM
jgi:hypothetical protein